MEDLPKDVVFNILFRVPVRTIASCRSVCKTWRKLVSHSSFVNRYRSSSTLQACLMVHHRSYFDIKKSRTLKLVELSIDDTTFLRSSCTEIELGMVKRSSNTADITTLGSVNGLICLSVCNIKGIDEQIYICNPITNDYNIIPKRYSSNEIVRYGFGVSMAGEYKVIRVLRKQFNLAEIEVYTLGTDQWRNLGRVPNYASAIIDAARPGLALNGRVHWLYRYRDIIYAFDLDNETVLQIPTPSGEEWKFFPFLGVLKGCLSLFARSQSYDRYSVWVMKEDEKENSWHKTWNTEYYSIYCLEFKIWDPRCLIDGINGTSNLIVFDTNRLKLVAYCLETGREEETEISNDGRYEIMTLMIYGPSFVKVPKPGV